MTQAQINQQTGTQSSAQAGTELEALAAGTPELTATDHAAEVAVAETAHEVTVYEITYQDVQTKIALRHPQAQINEALTAAIAHEQTTVDDAHANWVIECEQVQQAIDAANTHNDTNPEELKPIPELPAEPVIDLARRRACYQVEYVTVDLALTTEAAPAKVVYDDEALIAYHHPATEAHSTEHIEQVKRARFKTQRNINVSNIAVEVDGMVFDGDEVSQTRMSRAILLMSDTDLLTWVLNDNSVASVSKKQLTDACLLAAAKQSELWMI